METKVCKKCGQEKAFSLFTKNKKCKNGITGTCNVCENIKVKEWRANNAETFILSSHKSKAKMKKRFEADHEYRDAINQKRKLKRSIKLKENPDLYKAKKREDYLKYKIACAPKKRLYEKSDSYRKLRSKYKKKRVSDLGDLYIIDKIRRGTSLNSETIRNYPELIEAKKLIIKTQRLCRTSKN